jgi:hypothetical protein
MCTARAFWSGLVVGGAIAASALTCLQSIGVPSNALIGVIGGDSNPTTPPCNGTSLQLTSCPVYLGGTCVNNYNAVVTGNPNTKRYKDSVFCYQDDCVRAVTWTFDTSNCIEIGP